MTNEEWAKAIIIHLTGMPDNPTPMLLKMLQDIRDESVSDVIAKATTDEERI